MAEHTHPIAPQNQRPCYRSAEWAPSRLWAKDPAVPQTLGVFVVSWNRPQFLARTLESLRQQTAGIDCALYVVDNGSDETTRDVITSCRWLAGSHLLPRNLGINAALESILPEDLMRHFRHVLVSDADMLYRQPLSHGIGLLKADPAIGAVSYQHSPEHAVTGRFEQPGRRWLLKSSERGCALILRARVLQRLRPLPVARLTDFDWWVVRDAPASLQRQGLPIAVLPGAALHLGWRQGDSTWQSIETPEFEEYKV